ncbi:hypothetical protein PoMZ_13294 [Pyricularia oryzae]|uniref:Uncharacterized protein n=1 Tax=Pyricularia oryzae TaxID=318829 RepID=A0A4P7NUZ4_PYROR|nr:hypothetical protein PoMZ_13294 [Pyricularia oryzae]
MEFSNVYSTKWSKSGSVTKLERNDDANTAQERAVYDTRMESDFCGRSSIVNNSINPLCSGDQEVYTKSPGILGQVLIQVTAQAPALVDVPGDDTPMRFSR